MASKLFGSRSAWGLAALEAIRRRGQKPEDNVVVGDSAHARDWATRNQFCYVPADTIGEDTSAFGGLYVLVRTAKPFGEVVELAKRIAETAKLVTIADTHGRRRLEVL